MKEKGTNFPVGTKFYTEQSYYRSPLAIALDNFTAKPLIRDRKHLFGGPDPYNKLPV